MKNPQQQPSLLDTNSEITSHAKNPMIKTVEYRTLENDIFTKEIHVP